jgi:hypothetical protein
MQPNLRANLQQQDPLVLCPCEQALLLLLLLLHLPACRCQAS